MWVVDACGKGIVEDAGGDLLGRAGLAGEGGEGLGEGEEEEE